MQWMRLTLVVVGALIVTAFGIDAADTLRGESGTMLARVIGVPEPACPSGMRAVYNIPSITCVDTYEVSTGEDCPHQSPGSALDTQRNIGTAACAPVSVENRQPWRFITRDQAMQLCARANKRLPTSAEWYALALSMAESEQLCNVDTKRVMSAGEKTTCRSADGVADLVGNVWEWVSDDVRDGSVAGVILPPEGYVSQVDAQGIATVVSDQPQDLFGGDYFISRPQGAYGMVRGGYYESGRDAGIYAVHAALVPTSAQPGVGFRCVQNVL